MHNKCVSHPLAPNKHTSLFCCVHMWAGRWSLRGTERSFICQHLSGYGKCFEVYYRSFRAASEGFHFYCLEAGGGIIAPHCTGGSRGWRLAAAEVPIDYWPGVKFYPACFFPACARSFITQRDGMSQLTTRGREEKPAIWCFIVLFCFFFSPFVLWPEEKYKSTPSGLYFYRHLGRFIFYKIMTWTYYSAIIEKILPCNSFDHKVHARYFKSVSFAGKSPHRRMFIAAR